MRFHACGCKDEMIRFRGAGNSQLIVKNTGKRAGDEVGQLYVKHLNSSVRRPLKELKDFRLIHSSGSAGTENGEVVSPASHLAHWDTKTDLWVVEKDRTEIAAGGSPAM